MFGRCAGVDSDRVSDGKVDLRGCGVGRGTFLAKKLQQLVSLGAVAKECEGGTQEFGGRVALDWETGGEATL